MGYLGEWSGRDEKNLTVTWCGLQDNKKDSRINNKQTSLQGCYWDCEYIGDKTCMLFLGFITLVTTKFF